MDEIRTEAGKKLFNLVNQNYGSIIWGSVLKGILEIEKEAMITCCRANVIHNVYPDGMSIPEHMLNPKIGGEKPKSPEEDLWATQTSFEE